MASIRPSTLRATKKGAERGERGEEHEGDSKRPHHDFLDAGAVAQIVPDQQAKAAGKQVDSDERLAAAIALDVGAVPMGREPGRSSTPSGICWTLPASGSPPKSVRRYSEAPGCGARISITAP